MFGGTLSAQFQRSGGGRKLLAVCIEVDMDGQLDFEGLQLVVVRESRLPRKGLLHDFWAR